MWENALKPNRAIEKYVPLVDFIAIMLGDNCEVVLHDLTNPEASIVAIRNGQLSGRRVGGPSTDLVLKVMQDKIYKDRDYIVNYKASGKFTTFRSSSYFIRDDQDEITGMLCVNINIEPYVKTKELLNNMALISQDLAYGTETMQDHAAEPPVKEQLHENVDDLFATLITEAVDTIGIITDRMKSDEKLDVIRHLLDKGFFQLKGAVKEVAKVLEISEPTVYRYLNKLKE